MRLYSALGLFVAVALTSAEACADAPVAGRDAQHYSLQYRVPLSEAKTRLELQRMLADEALESRLGSAYPKQFAGLYLEHTPKFRLVIRMKGGRVADLKKYIRGPSLAAIVEVRHARHSTEKLDKSLAHAIRLVDKHRLNADVQVDLVANEVQVLATDTRLVNSAFGSAGVDASAIRIKKVEGVARPTALIGGGEWLSTCTTGFSVRFSSYRGVTTAGHCQDTQRWYSTNELLPYQSGAFSGSYDIQWHTAPGHTPTNRIWIGGEYRPITAYRARTDQSVGSYVCKYGRSTGYTCGSILSNQYRPSSYAVPSPAATYVRMGADNAVNAEGGDSGGPVFFGQTAYGSVSGSIQVSAYRVDMFYMPADLIQAYGLQILTY